MHDISVQPGPPSKIASKLDAASDRGGVGTEEKIRFSSSILPKWARRTKSLDALLLARLKAGR